MRASFISIAITCLFAGHPAHAAVSIVVDKNTQQMTVSVDGMLQHTWPVSSGNPSHETPNGNFKAFRMEEDHYSKEFDDAPMPNAIFFTKQGHAIHGTDAVNRLGSPASHGCVRLSRTNAKTLWEIVKAEGVLNTTVTLTGSSQVALARTPRPRANVATAREVTPQYDAYGRPLPTAPQQRRIARANPDGTYEEDINGNTRAYRTSPDDAGRTYQQQYYGGADPRWPTQQQRRIYVDPRTGQRYYMQDEYAYDDGYARQQYYYGPRGGY